MSNIKRFKYKPVNVKDAIAEIKDVVELMLDLAYSSILFKEPEFSNIVIELDDRLNELMFRARVSVMLAARGIEEIEELTGVLQVIDSMSILGSAAIDLVKILLDNIGLPSAFLKSTHLVEETITSAIISSDSKVVGMSIADIENETSIRIIAIKKNEWIINPQDTLIINAHDRIIAKGPSQALPTFNIFVYGKHEEFPSLEELEEPKVLRLIREIIIDMTILSELSIDLAYYAVIFDSKEVADEVSSIDDKLEDLKRELELNLLRYAKQIDNIEEILGLLRIAYVSEKISSASKNIADMILFGITTHPILHYAIKESDEIITRIVIAPNSELDGKSYAEAKIEVKTGMDIIALKKASTDKWQFHPKGDTKLEANDIIIAKGFSEDEVILKRMAGIYYE